MRNAYKFSIGNIAYLAVSDGTKTYAPPDFPPPPVFLFANSPSGELEDTLRKYSIDPAQWPSWTSDYTCLLVRTADQIVLVDTGAGTLEPSTGKLLAGLKSEGISPSDIDIVIITHGHPDHVGGLLGEHGRPAFPNARYIMQRSEWDFWMSGTAERILDPHSRDQLVGIAPKNLSPLEGSIDLIDGAKEILPGINALTAPGHTPGMMALDISSGSRRLLVVSDLVLHPVHLERPDWNAIVDVDPEGVAVSRERLLQKAADERTMVMAFHLPFPGLGYIMQEGKVRCWQPL